MGNQGSKRDHRTTKSIKQYKKKNESTEYLQNYNGGPFILQIEGNLLGCQQDPKFTSNFWKSLFKGLDTKLNFSTAYHSQTDGQTEKVNQVLEDMLRMYVRDHPKN